MEESKKFSASGEMRRYKERLLDESSAVIEREMKAGEFAQEVMSDALAGRSIVLVDTVLGKLKDKSEEGIEKLQRIGLPELSALIIQKAFGGKIPANADYFRSFFGEGVNLSVIDARKPMPVYTDKKVAAFLFSGSPANVSDALANPERKAYGEFSHGYVYDVCKYLYRSASEEGLPVIGICYGHQFVSSEHGSNIYKLPSRYSGSVEVAPTTEGQTLVAGVLGINPGRLVGDVPVQHGDAVESNPKYSALFLHTSDTEPGVTHGLLHIPNQEGMPELSGNPESDEQTINELLEGGKQVGISVQGHPELERARLVEFATEGNLDVFIDDGRRKLGADYLMLFARFLERHGGKKSKI